MSQNVWSEPITVFLIKDVPVPHEVFHISAPAGMYTPVIIVNAGPHKATIAGPGLSPPSIDLPDAEAGAYVVFTGPGTITGNGAKLSITIGMPFFK